MDELFSMINQEPRASIIEASTKLVLEWADQQKPVNEDDLEKHLQELIRIFENILKKTEADNAVKIARVKSTWKLSNYWYGQNKSATMEQLAKIVEKFLIATHPQDA